WGGSARLLGATRLSEAKKWETCARAATEEPAPPKAQVSRYCSLYAVPRKSAPISASLSRRAVDYQIKNYPIFQLPLCPSASSVVRGFAVAFDFPVTCCLLPLAYLGDLSPVPCYLSPVT